MHAYVCATREPTALAVTYCPLACMEFTAAAVWRAWRTNNAHSHAGSTEPNRTRNTSANTSPITSPHLYMNTPSPCHFPSSLTRAIASFNLPPMNGPYLAGSIGRFTISSRCSSFIPPVIQGTLSVLPHFSRRASTIETVKKLPTMMAWGCLS